MIKRILKAVLLIIILIISVITFASCDKKGGNKDEIQLWTYDYGQNNHYDTNKYNARFYSNDIKKLITNIENFCKEKEIPLKVMAYDSKTLSYDDYALKRNIAASNGNTIIIEDARYLWDLSDKHADYSKLENYNKLIEAYKDRFCIPIGIAHMNKVVNREILDYYDIKLDKLLITYDEYLQIKQKMKENGARFYLSDYEYLERINYFREKHDLLLINNFS